MKKIFIPCILLISVQVSFAQDSKLWLSLGAGSDNTSNIEKNYLKGNGFNVQADAFVPFYRKGWDGSVKGSGLTLGVNISGNYTGMRNRQPDNAEVAGRYQLYRGSVAVTDHSEGKTSGGFSGFAGIQARMDWGKFNLSPSVNLGYLHFKQKGYTQTGSLSDNGETQQKDLVQLEQQSTNGLVFKPQLKIGYNIVRNFSFFISPSMVFGPEINYTTHYLVPQGGFNAKNTYEAGQLAKGTWESSTNAGRYRLMEINAGITVAIGKRQSAAKQTQGLNFGEKVATGLQNGANAKSKKGINEAGIKKMSKPGGAVSSSYAAGRVAGTPIGGVIVKGGKNPGGQMLTLTTDDNGEFSFDAAEPGNYEFQIAAPAGKGIQEAGVRRGAEPVVLSLKGEPHKIVSPRDPASGLPTGKRIRIKTHHEATGNSVSNAQLATNAGEDDMILVEDGRFSLEITEPGSYKFQITTPEPAGKGINENGIWEGNPKPKGKPQARKGDAAKENLDKAGDAVKDRVAGGPLKGIDVKLGKNPNDGIQARASTNKKGEIEFKGLQPGIYEMEIDLPQRQEAQDFNTTRSNRERGQLKTSGGDNNATTDTTSNTAISTAQDFNTTRSNRDNRLAARPGGPIGGIIVKGGKNPGGAMTDLIVDNDGTIRFEVLEAGDYRFTFNKPEETQVIVNTTKSNTKD